MGGWDLEVVGALVDQAEQQLPRCSSKVRVACVSEGDCRYPEVLWTPLRSSPLQSLLKIRLDFPVPGGRAEPFSLRHLACDPLRGLFLPSY